MAEATEIRVAVGGGAGWRALAIFCGVGLGVAAVYLTSALLFADLGVFRDGSGGGAIVRLARFNVALGLVLGYVCASLWIGRRWVRRDVEALRGSLEASEADWSEWADAARGPGLPPLLCAAGLGALAGAAVNWIGGRDTVAVWPGHVVWIWILDPVLFAAMGVLVCRTAAQARLFRLLGRRARVQLGEIGPLAPFARSGLRTALLWFLGTSLASLLLLDTDTPVLVLSILIATAAIGVFSLLAPSRGVHERLREAKRQELGWLREEIARSSDALRRGDAAGAAQLPALLAWEARVSSAPEWPFDTSTWLRFALLLLVPLGSWLGGAFAEHVVERWFG